MKRLAFLALWLWSAAVPAADAQASRLRAGAPDAAESAGADAGGRQWELGIRHIVATPTGDSGALDIPMSRGFAGTVEAFWTERISTQFAASFVNPEAIYGNEVDLGTLGLDIYSATVRYHFAPAKRLSAYAGGGPAFVIIGNLDDQFGDAVEAEFGNASTFVVEGGVRYLLLPRLHLEAGVRTCR